MVNFIRSLCITLSWAIYSLIPKLFKVFYGLAVKPEILTTDVMRQITTNMYVLVSVVMLFALAAKSISAIVNPDLLSDNKKGVTGVIKRAIIALVLIVIIPFGFEYFYEFQTQIISKNLIEKFIMGIDVEDESNLADQYGIGQVLASTTLQSTFYPSSLASGTQCEGVSLDAVVFPSLTNIVNFIGNLAYSENDLNSCDVYNYAIDEDISYIGYLIPVINSNHPMQSLINNLSENGVSLRDGLSISDVTGAQASLYQTVLGSNRAYDFEFLYGGVLSVIAGIAVDYLLILFCIDSVVRLMTLAFLELTAPISIMAYIYSGTDMLNKWFRQLLSVAISFFLRVAAIAFLALILTNLNRFVESMPNIASYDMEVKGLLKLFLIIGTLIFVKKVPELIEKITGLKLDMQGGIGGRLGKMAGVGAIAQNAWKSLGNTAKGAVTTVAGLGLGAVKGGFSAGVNKFADYNVGKGNKLGNAISKLNEFENGKIWRTISDVAKTARAGVKAGGGMKTFDSLQSTWNGTNTANDMSRRQELAHRSAAFENEKKNNVKKGFNEDNTLSKDKALNAKTALIQNNKDRGVQSASLEERAMPLQMLSEDVRQADENRKKLVDTLTSVKGQATTSPQLASAYNQILNDINDIGTSKITPEEIVKRIDALKAAGHADNSLNDVRRFAENIGAAQYAMNQIKDEAVAASGYSKLTDIDNYLNGSALNGVTLRKAKVQADAEIGSVDAKIDNIKVEGLAKERIDQAKADRKTVAEQYFFFEKDNYKNSLQSSTTQSAPQPAQQQSQPVQQQTTTETVQQRVDRVANVHEGPTLQQHNQQQEEYNELFNSELGQSYLNAARRGDDIGQGFYQYRDESTGANTVNNVTNNTTNNNQTNTTNTSSESTSQQSQGPVQANVDLSGMQEAMRSAMGATNDILNRQLNEQQQQAKNLQDINQNTKSTNENVSKLDDRTYWEARREGKADNEANDKQNQDKNE